MPTSGKPKINSIMDAVTALTTLGDEESGSDEEKKPSAENPVEETEEAKEEPVIEEQQAVDEVVKEEPVKPRYIPEHKKPDAALTFPEKVRLFDRPCFHVELVPQSRPQNRVCHGAMAVC